MILSSKVKLRNFDYWNEDDSNSTRIIDIYTIREDGLIYLLVWVAVALSIPKAMRRPDFRIKPIQFPHLIFMRKLIKYMCIKEMFSEDFQNSEL